MSRVPDGVDWWSEKDAAHLVREMKKALAPDWCVGLTGSLLTESEGTDLDLIVYPWDSSRTDQRPVYDLLVDFGMQRTRTVQQMQEYWRTKGSNDMKHVEVYLWENRRVDVFLLR